jgi:hypothetical protein
MPFGVASPCAGFEPSVFARNWTTSNPSVFAAANATMKILFAIANPDSRNSNIFRTR